jgi:hypothetical protein
MKYIRTVESEIRKELIDYIINQGTSDWCNSDEIAKEIDIDARTLYKFVHKDGELRLLSLAKIRQFLDSKQNLINQSAKDDTGTV